MIKRVNDGESITEVALLYGCKTALLLKWLKIYRQYGMDGLKSLKQGRKKITGTVKLNPKVRPNVL